MIKYQNGLQKRLSSNLKFDSTAIESESVEASTSLFTEMKKDDNVIHNSKRLREINKIADKTDLKHALYIIRTVLSQFDWNNSIIFHIKKEDSFYKIVFSEIKKRITDNVIEEIKNVNYKKFCLCIVKDVYIDSGNVVVEINKIEHKQYFRELEQEKIQKYLDEKIKNAKHHHGADKKQNGNLISYMGIENTNGSNSAARNAATPVYSSNLKNTPTQYDKKRDSSQMIQNNRNTTSYNQTPNSKNFISKGPLLCANSNDNNNNNDQMRGSPDYTYKKRRVEVHEEIPNVSRPQETINYKSVVTSSINTNDNGHPIKNDFFVVTSEDHEDDDTVNDDNSEQNNKKSQNDDNTGDDDSSDNLGTVVQRFFRLK